MANSADPEKPTDLVLHCLQRQSTSEFSMTRVKSNDFTIQSFKSFNISMQVWTVVSHCNTLGHRLLNLTRH